MRDRSPGCATWLPSPTCGDCSMQAPAPDLLPDRGPSGPLIAGSAALQSRLFVVSERHERHWRCALPAKTRAGLKARGPARLVDRDGRCRRTIAQQRRQLPAEATRLEPLVRLRDLFGPPPTVPARPAAFALVQPRRVDLGPVGAGEEEALLVQHV